MLLVRIPLGTAQTQLVSQCAGKRGNCACILRKLRCGACTFTAHTLVRGSVSVCHFDACRVPRAAGAAWRHR